VSESADVVAVEGVTFRYDEADADPVLEDVSLRVGPRDFVGLIGPNGGGKTTLLRILLGLERPQSGTVRVLGRPPREISPRIGYVPQHAQIDATVPATVEDVVLTGRLGRSRWGFRYGRSHREAAREALARVGVAELGRRRIGELSGGQRQRVLIARAIANDVAILLLDEPMAGVDLHMERGILETLRRLNETLPILLVSHDVGFVSAEVDRVACLDRRLVVHRVEEVTEDIIAEMYASGGPVHRVHHAPDCPVDPRHEPRAGGEG
jgi:zinc transport system ATP-binding protein